MRGRVPVPKAKPGSKAYQLFRLHRWLVPGKNNQNSGVISTGAVRLCQAHPVLIITAPPPRGNFKKSCVEDRRLHAPAPQS
jgi:hypothetical protein